MSSSSPVERNESGTPRDNSKVQFGPKHFSVVSYNLLTDALASPEDYPDYPKDVMDPDSRLKLIVQKITTTICAMKPVFCFQEVPLSWCQRLGEIFSLLGYKFEFLMTHFKAPDFRWGLAVAFPEKIFKRESLTCVRLGGLVDSPDKVLSGHLEENGFQGSDYHEGTKSDHSAMVLRLRFISSGQCTTVVNTHLPCRFFRPNVMLIQLHALFKSFSNEAFHIPTIVAGDFNSDKQQWSKSKVSNAAEEKDEAPTPDFIYHLLSTGAPHPTHAENNPYIQYAALPRTLLEAYGHPTLGQKRSVTSFASTRFNKSRFPDGWDGHIDHIFYDASIELLETIPLPESTDEMDLLPNYDEGSDHLLIGATFALTD